MKFKYKNYCIEYDIFYKERMYVAKVYNLHSENMVFAAKTKKEAIGQMKEWFCESVEKHTVKNAIRKGFYIDAVFPDVLSSVHDNGSLYHVASNESLETILKNGLVPRGKEDRDVTEASKVMDTVKPNWVPSFVKRYDAIYFHPSFGNDLLTSGRENECLLATRLNTSKAWVGSQGVGGFCLFDEDFYENQTLYGTHYEKVKNDYGPWYWKESCSIAEYLRQSSHARKKDKQVGLDEVLLFEPIREVVLLGTWDEAGVFKETPNFATYVKDKYKETYKETLDKY